MAKTVKSFRNYNFENCDVDPKYYGDLPHANFFKGEFLPIARKEFRNLAKKLGAELIFRGNYFEYSAFFKKAGQGIGKAFYKVFPKRASKYFDADIHEAKYIWLMALSALLVYLYIEEFARLTTGPLEGIRWAFTRPVVFLYNILIIYVYR